MPVIVAEENNRCLFEIHTKHRSTLCEQNVETLNVKPGSTYSYH